MSFGSPQKFSPGVLPPPAPVQVDPAIEKAKEDLKARLRLASSRKKSRVVGAGLIGTDANLNTPILRNKL